METNFTLVKKLNNFTPKTRGILFEDEVTYIKETLRLNEMDVLQLRNLRDFVVVYFGRRADNQDSVEEELKIMDIVSGITSVIDQAIFYAGGEV